MLKLLPLAALILVSASSVPASAEPRCHMEGWQWVCEPGRAEYRPYREFRHEEWRRHREHRHHEWCYEHPGEC